MENVVYTIFFYFDRSFISISCHFFIIRCFFPPFTFHISQFIKPGPWVAFHFVWIILCIKRCVGVFILHNSVLRFTYCQNGVKLKTKMWLHNAQVYGCFYQFFFSHGNFLRAIESHEHAHLSNQRFFCLLFTIYFIQPFVHLLSNISSDF